MDNEKKRDDSRALKEFRAICPFWSKLCNIPNKGKTLVLCGAASQEAVPYPEFPDAPPRLATCPWHEASVAFKYPVIKEIPGPNYVTYKDTYSIIVSAQLSGAEGLGELEGVWEQQVEEFKKRLLDR